jgi:hypothetical protein
MSFALVVELFDRERIEERRETIAFDPQEILEIARRHRGEVIGAVLARRAVDAPLADVCPGGFGVCEVLLARVLRALEHHVLEEMREAAPARPLVLGADVEPLIDVDDRKLPIDVEDDLQSVGEGVLFKLDLWSRPGFRRCRLRRRGVLRLHGRDREHGRGEKKRGCNGPFHGGSFRWLQGGL